MSDLNMLRQEIDAHVAQCHWQLAHSGLCALWKHDPSPATAGFVISRFEKLRGQVPFVSIKLALVRTFTVEPVVPFLRASAFAQGIDLTVRIGDFNTVAQDFIVADSEMYKFEPDAVVLASQTRDIAPRLWNDFTDLDAAAVKGEAERVVSDYHEWFRAFRSRTKASLIVHSLEEPGTPAAGVFDSQCETGQIEIIQQINRGIRAEARQQPGVYVLDYDAVVAGYGRGRWYNEKKWLTTRLPVSADALLHLARAWLKVIQPLTGKLCKVLAVDLDNTLWGGVIGEDLLEGIQVGTEYPGAAFRALQRAILDLHRRGILLAVCSKNNPEDALEAIEKHPGMLLRREHFSAVRINWNDKPRNLREIAEELNVGTDSLAFLDDNPVERQRVRAEMPEVTVIELPADPMSYAQTLRDETVFERLTLSAEDTQRARYYAEESQRTELQSRVTSVEEFYHSLQQEVELAKVTSGTVGRVAQLTQKTNQFNLTTKRYTDQEICDLAARPDSRVYAARVRDKFGDTGIVGVCILRSTGDACDIDTFLLSCRVMGRTVETALLAGMAEEAREMGAKKLTGRFIPTRKNMPSESFFASHGFELQGDLNPGLSWQLDLEGSTAACPPWIRLTRA